MTSATDDDLTAVLADLADAQDHGEKDALAALAARLDRLETLLGPQLEQAELKAEDDRRRAAERREKEVRLDDLCRRRVEVCQSLPRIADRARALLANGLENWSAVESYHNALAEAQDLERRIAELSTELHR